MQHLSKLYALVKLWATELVANMLIMGQFCCFSQQSGQVEVRKG